MPKKKVFMEPQPDHPEEEGEDKKTKNKRSGNKEAHDKQVKLWERDIQQARDLIDYQRTRELLSNIN